MFLLAERSTTPAASSAEPFLSAGDCGDTVASVQRSAVPILAGLLILAGALLPGSAAAHSVGSGLAVAPAVSIVDVPPASPAVLRAQPGGPQVCWLLLGLAAGMLLGAARLSPRRALVVALALLLGIVVVEQGVHSVHHLGAREASACAVAAAAGHLTVALDAGAPVLPGPVLAVRAVAEHASTRPLRVSLGPVPARAPPASIA